MQGTHFSKKHERKISMKIWKRRGVHNLTRKLTCWPDFHCKTNHWRKQWMAKFTHHKLQRFQESTWQTPSLFTLEHLEVLGLPTKIITTSSLYTKPSLEHLKQMQDLSTGFHIKAGVRSAKICWILYLGIAIDLTGKTNRNVTRYDLTTVSFKI